MSPAGSSWPTSNVDSMMVLRARRGGTGSKYVTFRGGLRRTIPYLPPPRVSRARDAQPYMVRNDLGGMCIAWTRSGLVFRREKTPAGDHRGFQRWTISIGGSDRP